MLKKFRLKMASEELFFLKNNSAKKISTTEKVDSRLPQNWNMQTQ